MKKEAAFWEKIKDESVKCNLCSHRCKIGVDKTGICNVRKNESGTLYSLIYRSCSSMAADPIEKKPLYHFYPGTKVFSMGTVGCNFKCVHCQNYSISTAGSDFSYLKDISPKDVIKLAKNYSCQGVAYTYNEPTIWHEFAYESAKLAKKGDLYTCYVSNGFISEDPLIELSSVIDAINIDIKAFNEDFYKKYCKAKLKPVLDSCNIAKNKGMHLELTYLVIPTLNDSIEEIKKFCIWVVDNLGQDTPIHFSRFHPDYKLKDLPPTPIEKLIEIYNLSKDIGIFYPYIGNVPHGEYENTICPNCGNLCIERNIYSITIRHLNNNRCKKCGELLNIVI